MKVFKNIGGSKTNHKKIKKDTGRKLTASFLDILILGRENVASFCIL